MKKQIYIEDLVTNPTTRVPVALVLDTSASMSGEPIKELNEGYKLFIQEMEKDEVARFSAEVCVITFGNTVKVCQDFTTVDRINKDVLFTANGYTPMGQAVKTSLEILEERKEIYRETGIDYHQPWMVLMTDGEPTDDIEEAVLKTQKMLEQRKLVVFPIAVGPSASIDILSRFTTPDRPPLKLKNLGFREFFQWLSKSVSGISRSSPLETVNLPEIRGWTEL